MSMTNKFIVLFLILEQIQKIKMKYLLLLIVTTAMTTSCSMEYETWIGKDGSGQKEIQVDMSGMGAMGGLMEGTMDDGELDEEILKDNMDEMLNMEEVEDIMMEEKPLDIGNLLKNPMAFGDIDTMFVLYDVMPDSLKSLPDAGLMKNLNMMLSNSDDSQETSFRLGLKYDSPEEYSKTLSAADNFLSDSEKGLSNFFDDLMDVVDLKNGTVIIPEQDISDKLGEEDLGLDDMGLGGENSEEEDEEMMEMMSMMFGEIGLKYIYHLPGPVEFTSDPEAIIEGNMVTFKISFLDLMNSKTIPKYVIKFRP